MATPERLAAREGGVRAARSHQLDEARDLMLDAAAEALEAHAELEAIARRQRHGGCWLELRGAGRGDQRHHSFGGDPRDDDRRRDLG